MQRERQLDAVNTQIDVLQRFTKAMQLETLNGDLAAAKAQYEADKERAYADAMRRDRALEEFEHCVITSERSGIVIYPKGEAWKEAPEIEQGATVHKDQTLLLMPDLTKMQVEVGIHESVIERVTLGLPATITLPDRTLKGEVSYVSPVTRPAGWWTGNVVKYDVIVQLPETDALKPGMTAEVEVVLAHHRDVLIIPVTAVVETDNARYCWVKTADGVERRVLELGDSNNDFVEVIAGVIVGDEIAVDPMAYIKDAQLEAAKTLGASQREEAAETADMPESSDGE
jgi:multidrug efflux pump subunit AcrA (membrane-fusion protein)